MYANVVDWPSLMLPLSLLVVGFGVDERTLMLWWWCWPQSLLFRRRRRRRRVLRSHFVRRPNRMTYCGTLKSGVAEGVVEKRSGEGGGRQRRMGGAEKAVRARAQLQYAIYSSVSVFKHTPNHLAEVCDYAMVVLLSVQTAVLELPHKTRHITHTHCPHTATHF